MERDGRREGRGVEGKEISARSNNSTPPIEFRASWLAAFGVRQEGGENGSERASEEPRCFGPSWKSCFTPCLEVS